MKKIFLLLAITCLLSCQHPGQCIYEGAHGFVITAIKLGDEPNYGKYIYYTKDVTGKVTIWSNQVFNIGDTIFVSKK